MSKNTPECKIESNSPLLQASLVLVESIVKDDMPKSSQQALSLICTHFISQIIGDIQSTFSLHDYFAPLDIASAIKKHGFSDLATDIQTKFSEENKQRKTETFLKLRREGYGGASENINFIHALLQSPHHDILGKNQNKSSIPSDEMNEE